jgi:hypothetical protein
MSTVNIRELDLGKCGLSLVDGNLVPSKGKASEEPDPSWDADRLGAYAKRHIDEATIFQRKTTGELYRAGHALKIGRDQLKPEQGWMQYLKDHGIPQPRAHEAIKIYEHFNRLGGETTAARPKRHKGPTDPPVIRGKKASGGSPVSTDSDPADGEDPPPADDQDSMRAILVRIADRLGLIAENLSAMQPADLPIDAVETSIGHLQRIRDHAATHLPHDSRGLCPRAQG